jgi:hypothetical protein
MNIAPIIYQKLMIISEELIVPFIKNEANRIITFRQFSEKFLKNW